MITGFNTDVEHDGVIYHVQTEDKGLDSPLILSLVYSGGAILASKRSRYEDLIASGFNENVLAERLTRQHRLICAAIRVGRVDELKRMGTRESDSPEGETAPPDRRSPPADRRKGSEPGDATKTPPDVPEFTEVPAAEASPTVEPAVTQSPQSEPYSVYDPRRQSVPGAISQEEGLRVTFLDEQSFHAGASLTLRIMVSYRSAGNEKPKSGAAVSVKVLGTTFRPQIYSVQTQREGVAVLAVHVPNFTSGRAAILVRAVADADAVEIRRVIHPAH